MGEPSVKKKELPRDTLIEIGWLVGALFGTTVICYRLFNLNIYEGTADLQVYDTYFVLSVVKLCVALFLLVTFGSYLVRTIRQRFSRALPNGILLAAGLLLIASITVLTNDLLTEAVPVGYVVYPPLAAVPTIPAGSDALIKLIATVTKLLVVFQLLVTASLVYAAFQWGKRTN